MILGFIKTKEEVKCIKTTETTGEEIPQLPPTLPNEVHPHEYLHRESDNPERSFRPHTSLARIAIREKFVSILTVCLSVHPSVCLSVCLSLRLSVCLYLYISIYLSAYLFIYLLRIYI